MIHYDPQNEDCIIHEDKIKQLTKMAEAKIKCGSKMSLRTTSAALLFNCNMIINLKVQHMSKRYINKMTDI